MEMLIERLSHLLTAKTARATARMANATITMMPRIAPTAEPVSYDRKRFIHGATHSRTSNAETLRCAHHPVHEEQWTAMHGAERHVRVVRCERVSDVKGWVVRCERVSDVKGWVVL